MNDNTCPICHKPYWHYGTALTLYWSGTVYEVYTTLGNSTVPQYCTGHPLYVIQPLEEEERTEVPKAFYDAFDEEVWRE